MEIFYFLCIIILFQAQIIYIYIFFLHYLTSKLTNLFIFFSILMWQYYNYGLIMPRVNLSNSNINVNTCYQCAMCEGSVWNKTTVWK